MSQLNDLLSEIRTLEESDPVRLLDALESAAQLPGGPQQLVARFGDSPSVPVLRALSFVLAGVASPDESAVPVALLDFVEGLETADDSTLMNSLTALKRFRANDAMDAALPTRPGVLSRLVGCCLRNPSELVHSSLLDYLFQLLEDEQLDVLREADGAAITKALAGWCADGSELVREDACKLMREMQGRS